MTDYRTIPASELGKGSRIKVEICETEVDLYWKMAIEVADLIEENNRKGEETVMIIPYGPLGPYARLVDQINQRRISLKNCWFFNMDEYLTPELKWVDRSDPLSFRGGMDRIFYSQIDPELNVPETQRFFPEPGKENVIWDTIQAHGKLDMCWGGVGITGHIAFNEPGSSLASRTRQKTLTTDTIIANSRFFEGDINQVPKTALTVGVATVMDAKEVLIMVNGHNKAQALRHAVEEPISQMWTISALQMHPHGIIVCDEAACDLLTHGTYKYFLDIEKNNL